MARLCSNIQEKLANKTITIKDATQLVVKQGDVRNLKCYIPKTITLLTGIINGCHISVEKRRTKGETQSSKEIY